MTITPAWYLPPIFDSLIVLVNIMQFAVPKVGLTPLIIYYFYIFRIIIIIRTIQIIGSLGFAHVVHCPMYIVEMKDRAQKMVGRKMGQTQLWVSSGGPGGAGSASVVAERLI
ncbi:hypothetical protein PanWU01x14_155900 [Parasponia andersonii]|uniref:Transmembrane protein n=1 Tax=Parasponia andersonii TaxID=3476 RepID=A0A2P5CGA5_PARAD|nr:hypothetical protein PanWU01x14_155900 [Parasponia andersonii]